MSNPAGPEGRDPYLTPEALDELISADLDGELAGATLDHGLTDEEARARLAQPDAVERRAQLAAVDSALEVEPLSEHERARLLRGARNASESAGTSEGATLRRVEPDSKRRRVPWGSVASVAAALVVVAGVASLVVNSDSNDDANLASGGPSPTEATSQDALLDTARRASGDLSNDAVLRRLLRNEEKAISAPETAPTDESSTTTVATDSPAGPDAEADLGYALPPAASECVASFRVDFETEPLSLYTGSADGTSVLVVVFGQDDSISAVVYDAADCRVLRLVTPL